MDLACRLLVTGTLLALAMTPVTGFALERTHTCSEFRMARHECPRSSMPDKNASKQSPYPNATRKEPNVGRFSKADLEKLNHGLEEANANNAEAATAALQPIIDDSRSEYLKALALTGLARLKFVAGDTKAAASLQAQAISLNSLDNASYFPSLITLAQMQIAIEDYAGALHSLDEFFKQSGAQSADAYALQGNVYYRLQKYTEAVAAIEKAKSVSDSPKESWLKIEMASYLGMNKFDDAAKVIEAALTKDPGNSELLQNLISIYTNSGQNDKAMALLERARATGQITGADGYLNLAKMYYNMALTSDDHKPNAMKTVAVLKEGLTKGVLKEGYDSNRLMGDAYVAAKDYRNAAAAYGKAAPYASNGEADFLRGQALDKLGQDKPARDALRKAVAKGGFKRMGAAYLTLGNIELALKNRSAAITAYQKAARDPETRTGAQRMLKQLGQK